MMMINNNNNNDNNNLSFVSFFIVGLEYRARMLKLVVTVESVTLCSG